MTSVNITARKQVLAISGSIRQNSSNHLLLEAIRELVAHRMEVTIYPSVGALPHFDPGLEGDATPAAVTALRSLLQQADGVIVCTPEYAHGVPGSLKNAIDWMVGSGEFSQKPTVLITASTDGRSGHQALLETLRVLEAKDIDQLQLLISFIRTKVSKEGKIVDAATSHAVGRLMDDFIHTMDAASDH